MQLTENQLRLWSRVKGYLLGDVFVISYVFIITLFFGDRLFAGVTQFGMALFWLHFALNIPLDVFESVFLPGTTKEPRDPTFIYLMVGGFIGMISSFLFPVLFPTTLRIASPWAFYASITTLLLSRFLRLYSVKTLGEYFTYDVHAVRRIVDSGPYAHIRHPAYLGAALSLIAVALPSRSWISVIVSEACILPAIWLRIRYEEHVMVETCPEYQKYKKRVLWRLVPFIF